jgi:putative addiction module component (TIGR02574 family)
LPEWRIENAELRKGIRIAGIAGFAKVIRSRHLDLIFIMENITAKKAQPELTLELKQELDRRARAYDANPDDVMTREEVRASILRAPTRQPDRH